MTDTLPHNPEAERTILGSVLMDNDVLAKLQLDPHDFYTAANRWEAEPGEFEVFVGGSSAQTQSAKFTLRP